MSVASLWLYRLGQWLALALAALLLALALIGAGRFYQQLDRPFSVLVVSGELRYLEREALQAELAASIDGGFLSIDLLALRDRLEANPWIERVQLRRRWPAQLQVEVTEERPVARWGERGFLNYAGQPLQTPPSDKLAELPLLNGDADSAAELVASYQLLASLLQRSGLSVAELARDSRGGWQLTTRGGVVIALGRTQLAAKVRRFNAIWAQQLHRYADQLATVDLRYPNGAAVGWRGAAKIQLSDRAETPQQPFTGRG